MPRRMGLGGRLLALLGLGVAVTLAAFSVSAYLAVRDSRDRQLEGRLALAQALAAQTDHVLQQSLSSLQQIAFLPEVNLGDSDLGPEKRALQQAYFSTIFTGGVYLLNANGVLTWREPPRSEVGLASYIALPQVREALDTGKPTVSDIYKDPVTGRSVVSAALPIRDAAGSIAAVIGGDIDLLNSDLQRMATATGLEAAGDIQIVDSKGVTLASTVPDYLLTDTDHAGRLAELIAAREAAVGTCRDCREATSARPRRDEIMAFAPMSTGPWAVVLWEGNTDVLGPVESLRTRFIIFGVAIFAIGSLLAWALAQSVARPVRVLTDAAQKIASGRLGDEITIAGEDEVGRLGLALETMRQRLHDSLERIRNWNRELEERVAERTQELEASRNRLESAMAENIRLYQELQQKEALRSELLRKVIGVQEEERRRIARELHDETSQALTALILSLETASRAAPSGPAEVAARLREADSVARGLLENVHRLIFDLRPSVLDDLGLVAAVRWYAQSRLEPLGARVHLETEGSERRLPSQIETAVFRVTQEALTNIARHAEAENVALSLAFGDGILRVEVEDDGRGFDVDAVERGADSTRGLGLLGMRERVALLDGTLTIDSAPGAGTTVRIEVPLPDEGEGCNGHPGPAGR